MSRKASSAIAPALLALALSSCAGVTAVPAPPGSQVQGIRIYERKPLLIVSGQEVKITFVPNTSRAYALQFYSFLAKHDLIVNFTESGWLSSLTSNQDTTAVAKALIDLVTKAVDKGVPIGSAFSGTSAPALNERIQIYDFIFSDSGELIRLRPLINQNDLLRLPRQRETAAFLGTQPGTVQQLPSPTITGQTTQPTQNLN